VSRPRSRLQTWALRAQLALAAGLSSVVLGAIISAAVVLRVGVGEGVWGVLWHSLLGQVWVLAILPAILYLLARLADPGRPWRAAGAAVAVGLGVLFSLDLAVGGLAGLTALHPLRWLVRLGAAAVGTYLGQRAIRLARGRGSAPAGPPNV
jgi:hypothetical protein